MEVPTPKWVFIDAGFFEFRVVENGEVVHKKGLYEYYLCAGCPCMCYNYKPMPHKAGTPRKPRYCTELYKKVSEEDGL